MRFSKYQIVRKCVSVATVLALSFSMISVSDMGTVEEKDVKAATTTTATTDNRIRVDLNNSDGRVAAYSDTFNNWIITNGTSDSRTYNGVTFKLSNGGSTGSGIKGGICKTLIKTDYYLTPKLTLDGAVIDSATSGGVIKLEISGLSAGTHTLTTWHSFFDNVSGSSMSISINGKTTASGITTPTRVTDDDNAGISYSSFTATAGQTVTVLIKPDGNGTYNNAVLNAFEIDGANPSTTIKDPTPVDGEDHFVQDNGLSWTAGKNAVSHNVYLGTDFDTVNTATTSSSCFMGNQTSTKYSVSGLSSLLTYYWRVDEVTSSGSVTKGEVMPFRTARLAFPTAEGYGRFARGGRGGRIIEVTNLNDSGAGSLREAIEEETGPRIIVFRVGGVIKLQSKLVIPSDGGDVYVAGQTAPGDGITIINYCFGMLGASDVIIRDIRTRVGDSCGTAMDGMGMASSDNSIIDHCSISWTTDEGTSSRGSHNITFQHNIIAEALNNSVHYNADDRTDTETHSFAGSISGMVGSFHHNLLVNCTGRNWSLAGGMEQDAITYGGALDITNNVVYNWRDRTTDGGVRRINFVNNYYKAGAVSNTNMHIFSIDGNELSTYDMQMAYVSGNKMVATDGSIVLDPSQDAWTVGKAICQKNATVSDVKSSVPFFPSYVNTQTADEAYASVIADVGATMPKQDYLDQRYIKEVKNGTYTYTGSVDGLKGIIDSQDDVGGYPTFATTTSTVTDSDHDGMSDTWETKHGLNPNDASDGNKVNLSDEGYTNVEMYLNELAGDDVVYGTGAGSSGEITSDPIVYDGTLVKNLTVNDTENGSDWCITSNLAVGNTVYGDRTVTFTTIPDALLGSEYIQTACDSKSYSGDLATFTAGSNMTVYVGLDSRMTAIPSWLSGWTSTGLTMTNNKDVTFNLYKKTVTKGTEVTLGANGTSTGVVNYIALASTKDVSATSETPVTSETPATTQTPVASPTVTTSTVPAVTSSATSGTLQLSSDVNAWSTGYSMTMNITNTSSSDVSDWTLVLNKSDFTITSIWCAKLTETSDTYIITPESWNQTISAGGTVSFGFQATGTVKDGFTYTFK